MRVVKSGFFLSLAVWLGGALVTSGYGTEQKRLEMYLSMSEHDVLMMNLRGISINLFGPLTIVLGLVLAGAWIYRRVNRSEADQAETVGVAVDLEPIHGVEESPSAIESEPGGAVEADGPLRCDFSGWIRRGNGIVQEYSYKGQGLNHKVVVEITVEQGSVAVLRFVNLWLFPANGAEGAGDIRLLDDVSGSSPGWIKTRFATAAGNSTLMNILDRKGADDVFQMFKSGSNLQFAVRCGGEELLSLPMPNEPGLEDHYAAVLRAMKKA